MPKKDKPSAFSYVLKATISLDDREWTFDIPGLPGPDELDRMQLVKKIAIRTDMKESRHTMALRVEKIEPNRAIKKYPLRNFILASFEDFRPIRRTETDEAIRAEGHLQPAVWRECADYVVRFLRAGVVIQGVEYNFYGHSNSQLKSRSCFLYAAPKPAISRMVESLGDFSKMKTVGKKAKRIGLLFSTARVAMDVPSDRCEDIPDIETPEYIFTDGCGLIAPKLARELARRVGIVFRDRRYTPSVFQIRYRGYKGVVTVDPRMDKGSSLLKMRKSMKKFSGGDDDSFAVVDHSRPYSYGFLNDESIILLDALGIPRSTLLRKQDEHFGLLSAARKDPRAAFCLLSYLNRPDLAEKVVLDGPESVQAQTNRLISAELGKMLNKRDEQRCRIFIQKSRLLFGVCDAWGVLMDGECAVKVTMEGDGLPYALKGTEVSVIRNPCLHPGDWQKFRVVERPELAHLVDCIVFSTKGKRPAADMMSGGDLDGDQFFVCWDKDLIPSTLSQPALYPGGREPLTFKPVTDDDRLVYFAKYRNASLGQVKNLYLDWARAQGSMSPECQELNRLFSQSVDGNRIRIPKRLEAAPEPPAGAPPFVLDELHEKSKLSIRSLQANQGEWGSYEFDVMDLMFSRDDIAMSEFEFIRLAFRWCRKNAVSFESVVNLFDFNALTDEQKAWVLEQLPPSIETSLVLNAVVSSNLLSGEELSSHQLDHAGIHWKRVYDSERGDRLATFLDAMAKNLEMFHRKLIVFRPDERLTLAIYVPGKVDRARDVQVDDSVHLFAFPHSQGPELQSRLSLPTKMTYRLYCDENMFQLFENQRANSWIFMARPGSNDTEYRGVADPGDRRRRRQETVDAGVNFDVRASVALDKFSRGLQRHIGRVNRSKVFAAEIYVISNRDISSMQNLDLWLEYVATGERMPLNQQTAKEYTVAKAKDVLTPSSPEYLIKLVGHRDLSALSRLRSVDKFILAFDALLQTDDKSLLLKAFDHLLQVIPSLRIDTCLLLEAMLGLLTRAPYLAISFGRCADFESYPEELASLMSTSAHEILRAFILCANEAEDLMIAPMKSLLGVAGRQWVLTMGELAELIELVSLTVRDADVAMDILLEVLEPESARLLVGEPEVVGYFARHMVSIALDHIGGAAEAQKKPRHLLELKPTGDEEDGYPVVQVPIRVDTPGGTPEKSSHVRLTASTLPANVIAGKKYTIDAMVVHSEQGLTKLKCFHPLPVFFEKCSWDLEDCGPFVTTKAMLDAVLSLAQKQEACCQVADQLLGLPYSHPESALCPGMDWSPASHLNPSQNAAVQQVLRGSLTCLWGPPGTGKTETIVEMIRALQENHAEARVLITAPTHNAVDNAMRRYVKSLAERPLRRAKQPSPLRVSTDVRKVAEDLRTCTCDAMAGAELHTDRKAMKQAKKRVKEAEIIFTTCIGSALGLLRSEDFHFVIVDEASQQTEPASLVPLVKGCVKAVLVGDHVQLRPTVTKYSLALGFDVSLFERLYADSDRRCGGERVQRLMLDTQYRMHPQVSGFSSKEFYGGKLKTGISAQSRPLFASCFPWPDTQAGTTISDRTRMVFVECGAKERPGQKSKENEGQAQLCAHICKLLTTPSSDDTPQLGPALTRDAQSIAVLTPYTKQAELLSRLVSGLPGVEVSSIDGFQGREADVVVFVTVRCNEHGEIGFLRDLRRMNVAVTRARAGLIVVGNMATLTGGEEGESKEVWRRLMTALVHTVIEPPGG